MEIIEKYLSFEIENRKFAFEAKNVLEVLIDRAISPIPQAANYIAGVINFRGEVVTVVDTTLKFGINDYQIKAKRIIIVISIISNNKLIKLGCLCDNVLRMETINFAEIQEVPSFGTYYNPSLLKGVFYINQELYTIIDIEKVFTSKEVLSIESMNDTNKI